MAEGNDIQQVTTQLQPIYDKLRMGETNLTQEEANTFTRGFDTLQQYVSSNDT